MSDRRIHFDIRGIVQGVGFRPFLHRLTDRFHLAGWARNTGSGVELELEGRSDDLDAFLHALKSEPPPLALIREIHCTPLPDCQGDTEFKILSSAHRSEREVLVSPDVGICSDCLRELHDPSDRRYRYPFLNCTNCGPRFTIIRDVPYDRERTSMEAFPMCPDCQAEYSDIKNRRYHAQPNCCSRCGPALTWLDHAGKPVNGDPLEMAKAALRRGDIIAVKGLGAFHLACIPAPDTVSQLRHRKHRDEKPFALMCADLDAARSVCHVSDADAALLTSHRRPIVLMPRKHSAPDGLSDNHELGLMLPYTPLHELLMEEFPLLIMTSANLSDLPAIVRNEEAVSALQGIADGFLLHNREIVTRCDDSLVRVFRGVEFPLRRSRGYAPEPIPLSTEVPAILACGAEQKASFCLSRGSDAFLSQHIGDLKNAETFDHYQTQINHFEHLFGIVPTALVCDAHPDYLSTSYACQRAKKQGLPLIQVQHHHSHMVSCMTDNGLTGPCIGLIWDGTGYGDDGTIWGSECLVGDAAGYTRISSIRPLALPGGDLCTHEIGRTAHSLLWDCSLTQHSPAEQADWLDRQLNADLNCPRSSGMGRLFDGVYALLSGRTRVSYEGQGAILLETLACKTEETLPLLFYEENGLFRLDTRPIVTALVEQLNKGRSPAELAGAFMNTLVAAGAEQCRQARRHTGLDRVVLSGGVFQNMYLLPRLLDALQSAGFQAYHHSRVSTNDEGIALGQLMIAHARRKDTDHHVPCHSPAAD